MTVPTCGATTAVRAAAVVGTDRSIHRADPAQRGVGHRDCRVGHLHRRLLHPAEGTDGCRHARDSSSYAQFLTPLIALQAISFASISGAFRAATDAAQGINRRFGSMPIATLTPTAARMSANVYRCVVGLAIALICGYVIGFRFHRGPADIVGFCLLVLLDRRCAVVARRPDRH